MVDEELSPLNSSVEESTDLQDPFETEETLSLCDLPIHSDSFKWEDDFSNKFDGRYSSDEDNNVFEFFSEDFTASTYPSGKEVIFCGKYIPYKAELPTGLEKTQNFKIPHKQNPTKKNSRFQWKSLSFKRLLKQNSSKSVKQSNNKYSSKPQGVRDSKMFGTFSGENKVSLSASSTKSRWYLFLFGMGKFPIEMELTDIKSRQSKRFPSPMFSSSYDDNSNNTERRSDKGLWRLLRGLGYRSQPINAVTKTL